MAGKIQSKFITVDTLAIFQGANYLNSTQETTTATNGYVGNIPYNSIVFIKDQGILWSHGKYFGKKPTAFNISASATSDYWSLTATGGSNSVSYTLAPYDSKQSTASFYTGTTVPTLKTRLNFDGYLYATAFSGKYFVESASTWTSSDRTIPFSAHNAYDTIQYVNANTSTGLTYNPSTGALKAGSFVKRGGTSSQFLKADGTVDSTTYASQQELQTAIAGKKVHVYNITEYAQGEAVQGITPSELRTDMQNGVVPIICYDISGSHGWMLYFIGGISLGDEDDVILNANAIVDGGAFGETGTLKASINLKAEGDIMKVYSVSSTALALLDSPEFTGTPKAPTASAGTNTTQIATTAFVQNAISTSVATLNGALQYVGLYTPTASDTNTAPVIDSSLQSTLGTTVKKGYTWIVGSYSSTSNTYFLGTYVEPGDMIIALVDNPGTTIGNYNVIQKNLNVNDYLPTAGGTMLGQLKWNDAALPKDTNPQYFLTIDSFASGGTTKWTGVPNIKTALGISNLDDTYLKLSSTEQTVASTISSYSKGIVEFYRSSGDHIAFISFANKDSSGNKRSLGAIGFYSGGVGKLQYRDTGGNFYNILHAGNSSVTGGGSTWGSSLTVKINGIEQTLTIPSNPNTDSKVAQQNTTTTDYRALLLSYNHGSETISTGSATQPVYFNTGIYAQPSTASLYATKFVTNNGTSSQFVKGDGSLDSNTYQTTIEILDLT